PAVAYAEPNYLLSVDTTPNDPGYSGMWGLDNNGQTGGTPDADIDAPEAWSIETGDGSVVVGIIDTGIDVDHPDLVDNLWTNPGEIAGNGIDDDSNGYVDDVHGINAITGTGNPDDDHGHGTHTAGTIGATGNNGTQVVGVAWDVQLMACKFLDASGSGSTADAIECVQYTTLMGAKLTSN
ncbi:MAG: S8 family serine peptidase, partial [Anaerolineae bacterium]|nr:S8 family serine peptidase [Anaerolineae bacterium]